MIPYILEQIEHGTLQEKHSHTMSYIVYLLQEGSKGAQLLIDLCKTIVCTASVAPRSASSGSSLAAAT